MVHKNEPMRDREWMYLDELFLLSIDLDDSLLKIDKLDMKSIAIVKIYLKPMIVSLENTFKPN